ncbi:MAG: HAMP domain-containing histidine kinase, partial [Polyangiaceae bacterium]|nr:HAMP domain-containing histidine kinase [Polyangiaceae bacterium]
LLDAATIEAGTFSVVAERCSIGSLIQDAFEIFEPLAARKAIRLTFASPPTEQLGVYAERERVIQVLSNLLANAIKFTPEGGAVTVGVEALDHEVRIFMHDTGAGIPAEHLSHVFSRYWKAEKGGRRGAGLGLYIAKGVVEAHGGQIWVESVPGEGSTFFFTLPSGERPSPHSPLPAKQRGRDLWQTS